MLRAGLVVRAALASDGRGRVGDGIDRVAGGDLAAGEDVGAEAGVDECAHHPGSGQAFEVFAWLAEPSTEALSLADSEAFADEVAERKAADDDVAAGGRAVDPCSLERVCFDQGQMAPALVGIVRVGADAVVVAVAFESASRDCDCPRDRLRKLGRYRGEVDRVDEAADRESLSARILLR
jgi:hypothetical protein